MSKKGKDDTPINLIISPETMDENAKGQYEIVDVFCNQLEQMGLGNILSSSTSGKTGVQELREYNDQKMKEYDPEYLKKKEETRVNPEKEPEKPTRRRFEL